MRLDDLAHAVNAALEPKDKWNALRKFYEAATPLIKAEAADQWAIDPYAVDWLRLFTPIEFGLWQDIRQCGAVLYPQYPIGRYFADFANPVARVVVECDGAAFHVDKEKDRKRDRDLTADGWAVYRLSGRECLRLSEIRNELGEYVPVKTEAEGLIRYLCRNHGIGPE